MGDFRSYGRTPRRDSTEGGGYRTQNDRENAPPVSQTDRMEPVSAAAQGGSSTSFASREDRVLEEHRDGHGPHPPGDGRNRPRDLVDRVEVDVPAQPRVGAVHADVDHRGTGLHPVPANE